MACPQCEKNPKSHSFLLFGEAPNGVRFWYTGAGKAEEAVDTPVKFGYFKKHMDQAKQTKWVWVFDCAGMVTRQETSVDFMKNLVGTLSSEHASLLQGIWVINPTMWIRAAIVLLSPFLSRVITKNIRYFKTADFVFLNEFKSVKLNSMPWRE